MINCSANTPLTSLKTNPIEKPPLNQQARGITKNIIGYATELFSAENFGKFTSDCFTNGFNTIAIAVPLVFVGCCVMSATEQENGSGFRSLLETIGQEHNKLYRRARYPLPTLALVTCVSLMLQHLTSSNNVSTEQKFSLKEKLVSLLKEKSHNFLVGMCSYPKSELGNFYAVAITVAMLSAFGIKDEGVTYASYNEYVAKLSYIEQAIVSPFFEEVFDRACIHSIINSSLKIVSSASRHLRVGEISNSTISKCSRVSSSVLFGLGHYGSLSHIVATGFHSYFTLTQLYDEKGFFASFGEHLAFNSITFLLLRGTLSP